MSIHETPENAEGQEWVRKRLEVWMQKTRPDLSLHGLPTVLGENMQPREFPDYKTWEGHLSTAYGEIKCRGYSKKFFSTRDYSLSIAKMRMMAGFRRRGFRAEFAFSTTDRVIYFLSDITHEFIDLLKDSPPWMTRSTNNGKGIRSKDDPCKLIPMKHFVDIEKHGTGIAISAIDTPGTYP